MNMKTMAGLGIGMAAAAMIAATVWPSKARKRRMAVKAIGKAANELGDVLKIF